MLLFDEIEKASPEIFDALMGIFDEGRLTDPWGRLTHFTSALIVNLATSISGKSLSGWGWQNGAYWLTQTATLTFAGTGTHTLRIQVREDGIQFDQIVLSPSTYLTAPPGPVSNDSTIVKK